jgi:hypothetical protein
MVVGWNVDFTVGRERTHRFRSASSVRAPAKTGHIPIDTAAVRDHVNALVLPGGNTLLHKVASTTGDESAWPGFRRLTRPRALWVVGEFNRCSRPTTQTLTARPELNAQSSVF